MATYSSRGPTGPISSGTSITDILAIPVFGIALWALVCAAGVTMSGIAGAVSLIAAGKTADIASNILLNGIGGVFAGLAVVAFRGWSRKPGHTGESFVSALFNKGLMTPELDHIFWRRALLGGLIGGIVGAVNGGAGFLNFPQFLSGSAAAVMHDRTLAITAFIGGGAGGGGIFSLIFLIIVMIVAAIIVALIAGFLLHLLLYGVAGATKGATKAYIVRALQDKDDGDQHPISSGLVRGFIVGVATGIFEAVFTTLGLIQFYKH
jgi:hypothetical protein